MNTYGMPLGNYLAYRLLRAMWRTKITLGLIGRGWSIRRAIMQSKIVAYFFFRLPSDFPSDAPKPPEKKDATNAPYR